MAFTAQVIDLKKGWQLAQGPCQPATAIEIHGNVNRFLQILQTSLDVERQDVVVIFLMLCCKVLYLSPSHIYTHTHTESDRPCDCTCFTSPPLCSDTNVTWQRGSFFCHWGRCTGPWTTHSNSNSHSCRGCDINVTHCLYSWADTGSPNFSSEQWSSREAHTPLSFIHLTNTYTPPHTHTLGLTGLGFDTAGIASVCVSLNVLIQFF